MLRPSQSLPNQLFLPPHLSPTILPVSHTHTQTLPCVHFVNNFYRNIVAHMFIWRKQMPWNRAHQRKQKLHTSFDLIAFLCVSICVHGVVFAWVLILRCEIIVRLPSPILHHSHITSYAVCDLVCVFVLYIWPVIRLNYKKTPRGLRAARCSSSCILTTNTGFRSPSNYRFFRFLAVIAHRFIYTIVYPSPKQCVLAKS